MTQIFLWGLQIGPKLAPKGPNYLKMSLKGSPSIVCLGPVQLEITRIKSYELIILNYLLEGNIWLRNMILQNELNIWFGSCFLKKYSELWAHNF